MCFSLVTEALKGAAIGRYIAKATKLSTRYAQDWVKAPSPDKKKLDARGKEYDLNVFLQTSSTAVKIKKLFVSPPTLDDPYTLNEVFVDKVWTDSFIEYKRLYWGNPDVIRDVRKKKLTDPNSERGNIVFSFPVQKDLLEMWLVTLNMLDFVKQFKSDEFKNELQRYHE